MQRRTAIVVTVDGLRASALGAYGNTTWPTPYLNELASHSLVADWHFSDCPTLAGFFRGAWNGIAGWQSTEFNGSCHLPAALHNAGVSQCLLTNDPHVAELADLAGFDQVLYLDLKPSARINRIESTHLARFFSQVIDRLETWQLDVAAAGASGLMWVHTTGLTGAWDAPTDIRAQLLEEDDPELALPRTPPPFLSNVDDPDALLAYRTAYAAQMVLLDTCLGQLFGEIERLSQGWPCLSTLIGARGFALGEHGAVGFDHPSLHGEMLQVPLLVQVSGASFSDQVCAGGGPLPRVSDFTGPADLFVTLADWFQVETGRTAGLGRSLLTILKGQTPPVRQWALAQNDRGEAALRSPAWLAHLSHQADVPPKLFAKPDDRWEANDIAVRCPEIVATMQALLASIEEEHEKGTLSGDLTVSEDLCSPHW